MITGQLIGGTTLKYNTLYSRTSTGATQIWYMERGKECYRSTSGQLQGILTVSEWSTAKPKNAGKSNAMNAEEQAEAEIQAKYEKQLKSGGYWLDINDIDKDRFFQPMLAKNFVDYRDKINWHLGVGIQIKYNGGRIIARKNGLFSRKGERYVSISHIEQALVPFFNKFPDAVLDGEGFNFDLRERLNEIMKLLRKTVHITAADLTRSKELIRFYVYDGYGFPTHQDGYITSASDGYLPRKLAIDNAFFAPCFADRYKDVIGYVPTWVVYSEEKLNERYQKFLEEKHEGAILRILDAPYENKRSKFLLKYKPVDDDEFRIVSIQDGDGKFANRIATVTCQRLDGKKFADGTETFDATFKGTEADAVMAWPKRSVLIDKVVTIYYNGLTGYGKPNYPRFDWENFNK